MAPIEPSDRDAIERQLGREPRAIQGVGHRCPCSLPDVVTTEPRLPNGTPFPTTFYLTCPRAASRIGTLEGSGLMKEMQQRLVDDPDLAATYRAAHERYLVARDEIGAAAGLDVPEITGISAGGMPDRVKCLHVLAGQSLAQGRGVNPLGDEVLDLLGDWWADGPCVAVDGSETSPARRSRTEGDVVAAIDCGTNTIKLLIGALPDVAVREMRMVRLGQGVDTTGVLADEALERAFAAIDEYAALIAAHDVDRVRFVATSATRDAANAAVFTAGVRDRLGIEPEVVSGAEEAALAFDGAVRSLTSAPEAPVLVVDIGGGSTELILGDPESGPSQVVSMDIGSVRLTERHLHSDPPVPAEVEACRADVRAHLDRVAVDPAAAASIIGVAGTVTTLAGGVLELGTDRGPTEQVAVRAQAVHDLVDHLLTTTVGERRALAWMHPGRADVILAGALILDEVLRRSGAVDLMVSPTDILDGIAWSMVEAD